MPGGEHSFLTKCTLVNHLASTIIKTQSACVTRQISSISRGLRWPMFWVGLPLQTGCSQGMIARDEKVRQLGRYRRGEFDGHR